MQRKLVPPVDAEFGNGKEQAQTPPKPVLKLPDLEQSKLAVLNGLTSQSSRRSYEHAIREFVDRYEPSRGALVDQAPDCARIALIRQYIS